MDKPTRISRKPSQTNREIINHTIKNTMPKINTANLNTKRATFGGPVKTNGISKEAKQKFYAKKNNLVKPTKPTKEAFGPRGGRPDRPSRPTGGRPSGHRPHRTVVKNYYNTGYGGGGGWGGYGWDWSYPYLYPVEVPVTVDTSESDKQQVKNEIKEELRRDMRPIRRNSMENQIIMILIGLGLGAILYKVFSK
jgi:hypothetical protein